MPRSIPLNGFFLYLRDQAASAARSGRGPDPDKGVGASPFAFTYQGRAFTFAGLPFTYGAAS